MRIAYDAYATSFGRKQKFNKVKQQANLQAQCNSNNIDNNTQKLAKSLKVGINSINNNKSNIIQVTFTGNSAKNPRQLVNICPEVKGFFNEIYASGGLGDVTNEYSQAMVRHGNSVIKGGMDARTLVPYHSFYNGSGGVRAIRFVEEVSEDGQTKSVMVKTPEGKEVQKIEFFSTSPNAELRPNEHFVIHGPYEEGREYLAKYRILERTDIQGSVKQVSEDFTTVNTIPYYVFRPATSQGVPDHPIYFVHTPGCASWNHSYNSGPQGGAYAAYGAYSGASFEDYQYGIFAKAAEDCLPQMKDNEAFSHPSGNFGKGFNPRSIAFHDRQAFVGIPYLTELSATGAHDGYWNGLKMHGFFHNPTRAYQGHFPCAIDFFQVVASESDWKNLKETNPDGFKYACKMLKKIKETRAVNTERFLEAAEILSPQELTNLKEIFKPYISRFLDENGDYNLCMIPIKNSYINFKNQSCGSVSTFFTREMQDPNTRDIAQGLTDELARVRPIGIVNGSAPSALGLNKGGVIGKGILNTAGTEGYLPIRDEFYSVITKKEEAEEASRLFAAIKSDAGKEAYFEHAESFVAKKVSEEATGEAIAKGLLGEDADRHIAQRISQAKKETREYLTGRLEYFRALFKNQELTSPSQLIGEIDSMFNVKEKNKQWLIDAIARASEESRGRAFEDELSPLQKLFIDPTTVFSKDADGRVIRTENHPEVLGRLSPYKKGDVLIMGWGRGDEQKGFATGLEGLLQYFKTHDNDRSTKVILGGGGWPHDSFEYMFMKNIIAEIEEAGHGDQVLYVNNFFPNKLVACADFGYFTSKFEPCGITPLQSFSAAAPVISHRTGGAPDFVIPFDATKGTVGEATGFLTDHAYMLNRSVVEQNLGGKYSGVLARAEKVISELGVTNAAEIEARRLDLLRCQSIAFEDARCIADAVELYTTNPEGYKQMMRNVSDLPVDWHNNGSFNGGASAMARYLEEVFTVNSDVCQTPLTKLIGSSSSTTYRTVTQTPTLPPISYNQGPIKNISKSGKIVAAAIGALALCFGIYSVYKKEKTQSV